EANLSSRCNFFCEPPEIPLEFPSSNSAEIKYDCYRNTRGDVAQTSFTRRQTEALTGIELVHKSRTLKSMGRLAAPHMERIDSMRNGRELEPLTGIEPVTSSLPRKCSTN